MYQSRHDADSYQRVEVITGRRRRRDWSDEEKARILAESAVPDLNISEVARRNGVSRGLLNVYLDGGRCDPARRQFKSSNYHAVEGA
jgi:transposase